MNLLIVEYVNFSITVPANKTKHMGVDVTKDGYTPLGVVGITTNTDELSVNRFYLTNNNVAVAFYNEASTEKTTTAAYIWVLYVKN